MHTIISINVLQYHYENIYLICTSHYQYLALSGTDHGVATANRSGTEVTTASHLQSAKNQAIHGNKQDANVKNKAIDMFATNVLHFGPTYSKTNATMISNKINTILIKKILFKIKSILMLPKIYIIVKQLSNASPTKKRHMQNIQKLLQKAVATPAINPTRFVPVK